MLVKDKVTGVMYDPEVEFDKLLNSHEFIAIMKRLKDR